MTKGEFGDRAILDDDLTVERVPAPGTPFWMELAEFELTFDGCQYRATPTGIDDLTPVSGPSLHGLTRIPVSVGQFEWLPWGRSPLASRTAVGDGACDVPDDSRWTNAKRTTVSEPVRITNDAYPALYQVADGSSVAGQRIYRRLVAAELAFVLSGAAFAVLSAVVPALQSLFLSFAAASLIGGIAMKLINRQSGSDQRWFDGRAVAETVKTQAWRYMMRVAPYSSDATADESFAGDVLGAMRARPALEQPLDRLPEDPRQISGTMRAVRDLPLEGRLQLYLAERLSDQARWYKMRAVENQVKGRRWFWLSLGSQVLAASFAFVGVLVPGDAVANVIGLCAAIAAAATAWGQLGRHDELSKSYALAYQELITIQSLAGSIATEQDLDRLVANGEGAISREHTMWMAKRLDSAGQLGRG